MLSVRQSKSRRAKGGDRSQKNTRGEGCRENMLLGRKKERRPKWRGRSRISHQERNGPTEKENHVGRKKGFFPRAGKSWLAKFWKREAGKLFGKGKGGGEKKGLLIGSPKKPEPRQWGLRMPQNKKKTVQTKKSEGQSEPRRGTGIGRDIEKTIQETIFANHSGDPFAKKASKSP